MPRKAKKKPFQGKKVYFSGSIRGSNHLSPKTYNNLINFMKERGAGRSEKSDYEVLD